MSLAVETITPGDIRKHGSNFKPLTFRVLSVRYTLRHLKRQSCTDGVCFLRDKLNPAVTSDWNVILENVLIKLSTAFLFD